MRLLDRWARALALVACFSVAGSAYADREWLGDEAIPSRYEIAVSPAADGMSFTGTVRIVVRTSAPQQALTLNARDLTVQSAQIDGHRAEVSLNEAAQTLTLTARDALAAGEHVLRIAYTGQTYDEAIGWFRADYETDAGPQRALVTQFEPSDGRRFAPMWDQPNRRAVFAVTVDAPRGQMAVSNMPVARTQRIAGGRTRFVFTDTPSMPSYLLFVGVGDFERIAMDVDGVDVGVVTRRGETERGREALEAAAASLRYYEDYFGIEYPLPKLDMIAVPGAASFGAMENWGAILYFDRYIFVDDTSSEADRQNVFVTIAHEVAHQWFGNLVTMNWWNDLWLNEGFASWVSTKATNDLHPDRQPWLSQAADGTEQAFSLDARAGSHPIVQRADTIDEANLAFDTITYEKGLAFVRMLEAYLGEDAFRAGVRAYLNGHLYGNAESEDLWRALEQSSGRPVQDIARDFTGQVGFPLLRATAQTCRSGDAVQNVALTQTRFAADEAARTAEVWRIPVSARRLGAGAVSIVTPQGPANIALPGGCGPFVINAGRTGLYRTLYDERSFAALAENMSALETADQLGLLLDYWAIGRAGYAPLSAYLALAQALPADADPLIVTDTAHSMAALAEYAQGRPSEADVRAYARARLAPFFARIGWTARAGEAPNEAIARATLIGALGGLGDEAVVAEARRRVTGAQTDPSLLPGDIRDAAIGVVALNADAAAFDAMAARARAETDFVEQDRLWSLLATARDPVLAARALDLVRDGSVPAQVRPHVILSVAGGHPRLAWDFVVAHRAELEPILDSTQLLAFAPQVAGQSSDPRIAEELLAYTRGYSEGARPTVIAAVAGIRQRADTISQRMPAVEEWIRQQERAR